MTEQAPLPEPTAAAVTTPWGVRHILQDLIAFLRHPSVLEPAGLRKPNEWRTLGALYLLHISVLLLIILPITSGVQALLELDPPDAFDKISQAWLIPLTVVIAPVLEELAFRGWQSGRPRALWLLGCTVTGSGALAVVMHRLAPPWTVAVLLATVAIAALGWFMLRKRATPKLFRQAYPWVFWLVALGFAGVHILNYGSPSPLTVLLVLPQFWAGIMLGFTRQRLGLGASMLQHAGANAAVMALTLIPGMQ